MVRVGVKVVLRPGLGIRISVMWARVKVRGLELALGMELG